MAIKLIALDLDGTLLNSEKKVSKANREAIRWALEQNIDVAFATGRSIGIIPPDAFGINDIRYMITSNGAVISDRKKGILCREHIPSNAVDRIMDVIGNKDYMIEAFVNGMSHTQRRFNDQIHEALSRGENPYYYVYHRESEDDIADYIARNHEFLEMLNINFPKGEDPRDKLILEEQIKQISGLDVTSALPFDLEIASAKAGKGNALAKLAHILCLEQNEIVSMGDSLNDMSMPDVSICVAMGNARDEVKERADFVTKENVDDGVAHAIYEIVEKNR